MTWKMITMTAEEVANFKHMHLQNAFGAIFIATAAVEAFLPDQSGRWTAG